MVDRDPKHVPPPNSGHRGPRKATIERLEKAERSIVEAKGMQKPLAKEMLEELMLFGRSMMGRYQPGTPAHTGEGVGVFWKSWYMTIRAAAALAPYQSPTYRAVYFSPEVIGQAEVSEADARQRVLELIGGIAPEILEDEHDDELHDEAELITTNGGAKR
jgi:hypothetical protein